MEDDNDQKIAFDKSYQNVEYIYQKNEDPLFHKTKLINQLCKKSRTPIIAIYDCDVLLPGEQCERSVESIRRRESDVSYPYDGKFYGVPRNSLPQILDEMTTHTIKLDNYLLLNGQSFGGCIFFEKDSFIRGGMANENFISWGSEDHEMFMRFTKLDYKVERIEGNVYHLIHPRGLNSSRDHQSYGQNEIEISRVSSMNRNELENYIKTWNWVNI